MEQGECAHKWEAVAGENEHGSKRVTYIKSAGGEGYRWEQ
jgi:hypothetical protein